MAMSFSAACAWKFNVSNVTLPENRTGKHESFQRVWTVSSIAQLHQLYLAVPGSVFVELDPSLLPSAETPATDDPATETPGVPGVVPGQTPGVIPGVVPGAEPGFVPGKTPAGSFNGSDNERNNSNLPVAIIKPQTMMLAKHHRHSADDDEDQLLVNETVVAKIIITSNSWGLLNMIEAAPLHPRHNDGLKVHLMNEDANAKGYVLTQIYVFDKNLLRRVTTAFSGDVVLNDDVMTVDDIEADIKFACVGKGNLFLKSKTNVSLSSLEIEVTGSGLVQLEMPSLILDTELDVEVTGSGSVALVTDALSADVVKSTLSGSGNIVVDTSNLVAQQLEASVYGSGVASFATAGSVEKESLHLSGSGQLLAGSIMAAKSSVNVWGSGELLVQVTDKLAVTTSVWGKVGYVNAPPSDIKIKGWWFWREASAIVYPAAVNKVVMYQPAPIPAKHTVYYSIKTAKSALFEDPNHAFVSAEPSNVAGLITTSLSNMQQTSAMSSLSHGLFYAFVGAGVVVANVIAARSWAERRVRGHYSRLV
ncbi:unnamed protein product [Peronospora belbahrii]|uniref:Putative auto-transporter adhesin head GIN domain-containing protein n=1 Tax=Peronospora belbahrii TaxID=622444 RepID=A0AAU9KUY8_9STRA|nr:unnamed protein product [Peronospora belbahrii]